MAKLSEKDEPWDPQDVKKATMVVLPLREIYAQLHAHLGSETKQVLGMLLDCVLDSYDFGQAAYWRMQTLLKHKDIDSDVTRFLIAKTHADLVRVIKEHLPNWDLDNVHYTADFRLIHRCDLALMFTPELTHAAHSHPPCEGSHLRLLHQGGLPPLSPPHRGDGHRP